MDDELTIWRRQEMLLKLTGVTPTQKLILMALHAYCGQHPGSWPSVETIAADAGLASRKSVQRNLSALTGAGGGPVFLFAQRYGEPLPEGVPPRPAKASGSRSSWYVINWEIVAEHQRDGSDGNGRVDMTRPSGGGDGSETATCGGESERVGVTRSGDSDGAGGSNVTRSARQDAPPQRVTMTPPGASECDHEQDQGTDQELTTTTTTREAGGGSDAVGGDGGGGGDSPEGGEGESRIVTEGMLRGVGVWPDAAARLAGLEHCDEAYAEATIASVRASGVDASREPERFGSLVAARIEKGLEPTKAGRDLVDAEREAAEKRRLAEGRKAERAIAERNHAESVDRDRAAWAAWDAGKSDDELAALKARFLDSDRVGTGTRSWWESRDPRGSSLGMQLMELEAAQAAEGAVV